MTTGQIAYRALTKALEQHPECQGVIDGLTPAQRFFVSWVCARALTKSGLGSNKACFIGTAKASTTSSNK